MLSAAVLVSPAPIPEPITVADAKRFLRIDTDSLDGDVAMLVGAARGDIEDATGLRLIEQLVEIGADEMADLAHLPIGPVSEVVQMRYRDASGTEQLLDPAAYVLTGAGLECGIAARASLPLMLRGSIVARLKVGFGDATKIPATLRWAILALVRGKFEDRAVDIEPLIVNLRVGA